MARYAQWACVRWICESFEIVYDTKLLRTAVIENQLVQEDALQRDSKQTDQLR